MERIHRFGISHGAGDGYWHQDIMGPDDATEYKCMCAYTDRVGYDPLPKGEDERILAETLLEYGCRLGPVITLAEELAAERERRQKLTEIAKNS